MTTITSAGTHHLAMMISAASITVLIFLLQLGFTVALQQPSVHYLSYRHQISQHRPITTCLLSATAVVVDSDLSVQETRQDSSSYWDQQFEELLSFETDYGHCNFPQNATAQLNKQYPTLARFCQYQRLDYKRWYHNKCKNSLKTSLQVFDRTVRFRRLEEIGFEFNTIIAKWYDKYHELRQYQENNGHVRVTTMENPGLYSWVVNQRYRRKGLSDTQIELLDGIGFEWESELNDVKWMANYNELVDYGNKHGNLLLDPSAGPIYKWMDEQRQRREGRNRRAPLSREQIKLLNEIDFPWEPYQFDAKWYAKYHELERFQQKHGHCELQKKTHEQIYNWSREQRRKSKIGILSGEQIKLLDKVNFPWEGKHPNWPRMYNELVEYCNKHDHLRVSEEDDPDLYEWMTLQRELYHGIAPQQPGLSDIQIDKLEELHFCWSLEWRERTWYAKYTEAVEFYKEYGHTEVNKKENPSLYNWIQTQGKRYKELKGHKPLSEEELELLEQIDFAFFDDQPRLSWNTMYAELERYREENDGRFPDHKDDPKLNRWMRQQRGRMRCEYGYAQLSDEQKCLLESISCPMLPAAIRRRAWYERYDELVEFWKQHGHFFVENKTLFNWVHRQRVRYKGCGKSNGLPMSKSEVYLLERIGFPWISDRGEVQWQIRYDELVQFLEAEGRFPKDSEHPSLYKWMANQRYRYKGNGYSDLSDHQIQKLEKIGFRWSMTD